MSNFKNKKIEENKSSLVKKISIVLNIFLMVVITIFIYKNSNLVDNDLIIHDNNNSFKLTNPILDCELDNKENAVVFSSDLVEEVDDVKKENSLSHISLYFRDLNNGPWVGVHEKEIFSPASLLKVPILIALLSESERDVNILSRKIKIKQSDVPQGFTQNFSPENTLEVGKEYELSRIMENMIVESDNIAVSPIINIIGLKSLGDVFKTVGVPYDGENKEILVRVKDYAGFFRVLYNASYLNRETSEKALDILSRSNYRDGIVAGVPDGVVVAHKFVERNIEGEKDQKQLHDCGVIYYPGKPYILCIMTRGDDFQNQQKAIKDLSSFVYSQVGKN